MKKITDLSFPLRLVMLLGAIELMNLSRINELFWYVQIQESPIIIFSAELIASVLLVVGLIIGLKMDLKVNPFLKRGMISLVIGLAAIVGIYFLSKWTGTHWHSANDDSVWLPYFNMENFLFMPILQELIFRELFLKIFPTKKAWLYIFCSSLVYPALCFMSLGFDLFLVFAFLSGLVFSALRWYSKDIKVPIVLHILLNLGVYFL